MAKDKIMYVCDNCGQESAKWIGKCPACGQWNTFKEIKVASSSPKLGETRKGLNKGTSAQSSALATGKVLRLKDISSHDDPRIDMHDAELNRVLGGGLVPGSIVLLGGEPGIPNAVYHAGERPWHEKGDIALPCATQNEINGEQAQALIDNGVIAVAEGANMPSLPEAIKIFQDAKILYSPGKASNAGGVSVSGLEMSQNSERLSWTAKEVDDYLKRIMNDIHENCVKYGTEKDGYINYVKGANVAGFMKVASAMMSQGIV